MIKLLHSMRYVSVALIALSTLSFVNSCYAAGQVFYDGFENGTTTNWLQDDFRNRCTVVSSAVDRVAGPYAGSRMLSCNHDATRSSMDAAAYETLKLTTDNLYSDELFIRLRVRKDQDMNLPKKILRFYETPGSLYHDLFEVAGHPQEAFNNAGNVTSTAFPTYWGGAAGDHTNNPSAWHKIEYYIRQSTGSVKIWHDGILVRNDNGFNFDNLKWSPFYLTSNGDTTGDASNHLYFDDFEIYSDLGTGGIGKMSDASITSGDSISQLPAPQNLRVGP